MNISKRNSPWQNWLSIAYNSTIHSTTEFTRFESVFDHTNSRSSAEFLIPKKVLTNYVHTNKNMKTLIVKYTINFKRINKKFSWSQTQMNTKITNSKLIRKSMRRIQKINETKYFINFLNHILSVNLYRIIK